MLLEQSNCNEVMRHFLKQSGRKIAPLAREIGVHRYIIYYWLSGRVTPSVANFCKFIAACGGKVTLEGLE